MSNVWRIGAGDYARDCFPLFVAHDQMFQGRGRYGLYCQQKQVRRMRNTNEG